MNLDKFQELADKFNAFDFAVPMEESAYFTDHLESIGWVWEKGHNITFDIVIEHHNWFMRIFFNKKNKNYVQDSRGHVRIQDIDAYLGISHVCCFSYSVAKDWEAHKAHERAR